MYICLHRREWSSSLDNYICGRTKNHKKKRLTPFLLFEVEPPSEFCFLPTVLFIYSERQVLATARIAAGWLRSGVSVLYLNRVTRRMIIVTSKHAGLSYKCPARKDREVRLLERGRRLKTHL